MNIFLNTGLLMEAETADIVIGVIAHETGHITGGHIIRRGEDMENATIQTVLGVLTGAAVMASGLPDAGAAIASLSTHIGTRNFLKHTRDQESSADQAAITFLKQSGYSVDGLKKLLKKLKKREEWFHGTPDPYAITHPGTSERINALRLHANSGNVPNHLNIKQQRIVAKLFGFLKTIEEVEQKYQSWDKSLPAQYARSIAYYRNNEFSKAHKLLDELLDNNPGDPYINELKGQILYETGQVLQALPYYHKASRLNPDNDLLKMEASKVMIATLDKRYAAKAKESLEKIVLKDPDNITAWRYIAGAYSLLGKQGLTYLAKAEEFRIKNKTDKALEYAKKAKEIFKTKAQIQRADDLIFLLKAIKIKEKEEELF